MDNIPRKINVIDTAKIALGNMSKSWISTSLSEGTITFWSNQKTGNITCWTPSRSLKLKNI